jgi:hypothetical protein
VGNFLLNPSTPIIAVPWGVVMQSSVSIPSSMRGVASASPKVRCIPHPHGGRSSLFDGRPLCSMRSTAALPVGQSFSLGGLEPAKTPGTESFVHSTESRKELLSSSVSLTPSLAQKLSASRQPSGFSPVDLHEGNIVRYYTPATGRISPVDLHKDTLVS